MRASLTVGVAMTLSLALASPTLAREESSDASPVVPTGPAIVTGVMDNAEGPWRLNASDPRVSGEVEWVELGSTAWTGSANVTIKGPGGNWTGPALAVVNDSMDAFIVFMTTEGTGAYEGWAFVGTTIEKGDGHGEVNGAIILGEAPRQVWPDPVEPLAE